jgi:hypothetical protein
MPDYSLITTEYPLGFLLLCLVLGLAYAFFLYRKDEKLKHAANYLKILLFSFRALTVSIIAFLLLNPVIHSTGQYVEEPIVVIAQDVSESMVSDTTKLAPLIKNTDEIFNSISENYDTKIYSFGESFRPGIEYEFSDKQTNISEAVQKVQAQYFNRNIGALILISDGIYNSGSNPIYTASQVGFPIHTIAVGNPEPKKDLILKDAEYNKIVFLNDIYPLHVNIEAKKLAGENSKLSVYENGRIIETRNIQITSDDFYTTVELEAKAETTGVRRLRFVLETIEGEYSSLNNRKEIIFEVIDSKQKILILGNSPHPDIGALKSSLDKNKNFETEFSIIGQNTKPLSSYNLVIMHQLPSVSHSALREIESLRNNQIPTLWIIGKQTATDKFNTTGSSLKIQSQASSFDPATGIFNPNFSMFELLPEIDNLLQNAPPLETPFGKYSNYSPNNVLFFRKIQDVETESPLVVFSNNQSPAKSAVITGEGLWRWKIYDYKLHQNHILFNEFIQKTCQYLSLKIDKDRFRVKVENIIAENQDVIFRAERYNKSYELINEQDVNLQLTDSLGDTYDFVFDKTRQSYELNLGKLAAGDYRWKAETDIDGKKLSKQGEISIHTLNTEARNTRANHQLLYNISEKTGGQMFNLQQSSELIKRLTEDVRMKPVAHSEKNSFKIIHAKLLFFLILLLLAAEWFIRKYSGSY